MDSTATLIIVGLALAWSLQYVLAFWQLRRFYGRVAALRRDGIVSIGMSGSTWRRKQYAVLVVDQNGKIVHAEQLYGWTVFAKLKPVPGLAGRPLSDLSDDHIEMAIPDKLLSAFRNAATYIQDRDKRAESARTDQAPHQSMTTTRRERAT